MTDSFDDDGPDIVVSIGGNYEDEQSSITSFDQGTRVGSTPIELQTAGRLVGHGPGDECAPHTSSSGAYEMNPASFDNEEEIDVPPDERYYEEEEEASFLEEEVGSLGSFETWWCDGGLVGSPTRIYNFLVKSVYMMSLSLKSTS